MKLGFAPRILLALVLVLVAGTAQAQQAPSPDPPIQTIPEGEDKIVPLRKGEPAPFGGQLFETDTAIRWGNFLLQYRYRLQWDVDLSEKKAAAEITYRDKLLVVEKDRAAKVEKDLEKRIEKVEAARLKAEERAANPPWYESRTFGMVIGVVTAVAVGAVAVAAIDALHPD